MRKGLMVLLGLGVVFGYGSAFAHLGRHHGSCHGWEERARGDGWRGDWRGDWRGEGERAEPVSDKTSVVAPTVVVPAAAPAAPAPVIIPAAPAAPAAAAPIIVVVPVNGAPAQAVQPVVVPTAAAPAPVIVTPGAAKP